MCIIVLSIYAMDMFSLQVCEQLANEIHRLQHAKWQEQLHIDRTNAWWDHIGRWTATIEHVSSPPEGR